MEVVPQRAELPSPARQRVLCGELHYASCQEEVLALARFSGVGTPDCRGRPPSPSLWPARATENETAGDSKQGTRTQAVYMEERSKQRYIEQKTIVITSALQTTGSAYVKRQKARDTLLREKEINFASNHFFPQKRTAKDAAISIRAQSAPLFSCRSTENTWYKGWYPKEQLFQQFKEQYLQAQSTANVFDNSARLFCFRSRSAAARADYSLAYSAKPVENHVRRPLIIMSSALGSELAKQEQTSCQISEMDRFLATQYSACSAFAPMLGEVRRSSKITSEPPEEHRNASNSSAYDSAKNSLEHYLTHRRKCSCK